MSFSSSLRSQVGARALAAFFLLITSSVQASDKGAAEPEKSTKTLQESEGAEKCWAPAVDIHHWARRREPETFTLSLTDCAGNPNPEALLKLSLLARPKGMALPEDAEVDAPQRPAKGQPKKAREGFLARGVRKLHPGLLTRLQAIADRFPGHAIEIVSGYRPDAGRHSRHRSGEALDIRVEGIDKEEVAEFAATLAQTGVGYYPNSLFTHIDVRESSYRWVDRSGPGQSARYRAWSLSSPSSTVSATALVRTAPTSQTFAATPTFERYAAGRKLVPQRGTIEKGRFQKRLMPNTGFVSQSSVDSLQQEELDPDVEGVESTGF